jgi:hypothetical protein
MTDYCIHEFVREQCGICTPRPGAIDMHQRSGGASFGRDGGQLKQDSVDNLCRALGLPGMTLGVGSSIPSELFEALAERFGVTMGSMPEIGEALVGLAGGRWDDSCDSRGSVSGGGSTVTAVGLERINAAVHELIK